LNTHEGYSEVCKDAGTQQGDGVKVGVDKFEELLKASGVNVSEECVNGFKALICYWTFPKCVNGNSVGVCESVCKEAGKSCSVDVCNAAKLAGIEIVQGTQG